MFEDDSDLDLATLLTTDLDIEPQFLDNPGPNWLARGHTELELIAACEQQIAYLHAMQTRALARFATHRPGKNGNLVSDFADDEIALAAGWTRAVAGHRLSLAYTLTQRLPATLTALADGHIDLRRAQRLAELTDPLPPEIARQVEGAVLPDAGEQNTTGLARAARKAIARLDPDGAQKRHEQRRKDRQVKLHPDDDAMAELRAYLPADQATRIHRTLSAYARAAAPGDKRTMDQRRADVLVDLILNPGTLSTASAKANVQVTMPITMLMGLDNQTAELAGYGPIPADVARRLAADATWQRLLTDPRDGSLLDFGRTTYRPPAALADFIRARDHTCVFPGCHRPADTCDIDHEIPYPQGATCKDNLSCLCRHHHRLKHQGGWTLQHDNGIHTWTTPTGRRYHRKPRPVAQPVATPPAPAKPRDDEPAPF